MTTLYRLLTGPDDSSFCHKVSKALSEGWELYGSPCLTCDPSSGSAVCGQAVIKRTESGYTSDRPLSEQ